MQASRRMFLYRVSLGGAVGLLGGASRAEDVVMQDGDQDARAIEYTSDAAHVDTQKFPKFRAGQTCANCSLYAGDKGAPNGPCGIVFGKLVAAAGWCSSWEKA